MKYVHAGVAKTYEEYLNRSDVNVQFLSENFCLHGLPLLMH